MKFVIVEGIPGSGKSTTARFISLQYERNGFDAVLYHESAYRHPILLDADPGAASEWMSRYLENWERFVSERLDEDGVVVLESPLFQTPILYLLHKDINRPDILRFINRIYAVIGRTDCRIVYLYQKDARVGIRRMMAARGGDAWLQNTFDRCKEEPYYLIRGRSRKEAHLEFLQEYASLANQAFSQCPHPSLGVDNTDWNWDVHFNNILGFLGISFVPDPEIDARELERFVGAFRNEELGVCVQVEAKRDGLFIFGDQRLKPRTSNKFYLDTISMTLEFVADRTGRYNAFLVSEKDLVGNRKDEGTRFERIP